MSSSPRRWDNADRVRIVRQRADNDQVDVHGVAFRRSQISVEIVKGVFEQPRCGLADLGWIASRGVAMAVQYGDLVRELFCGLRPGVPHLGVWGDESPGRKSMKCKPNSIVALLVSSFGQCCGMTRDVWALTRATAASFVEALEVIAGGVGTLQSLKLVVGEFDVEGGEGVVDLRGRVGTDNRGRHHGVVVQPGQGDRGAGNAASSPTASIMARSASAVPSV